MGFRSWMEKFNAHFFPEQMAELKKHQEEMKKNPPTKKQKVLAAVKIVGAFAVMIFLALAGCLFRSDKPESQVMAEKLIIESINENRVYDMRDLKAIRIEEGKFSRVGDPEGGKKAGSRCTGTGKLVFSLEKAGDGAPTDQIEITYRAQVTLEGTNIMVEVEDVEFDTRVLREKKRALRGKR